MQSWLSFHFYPLETPDLFLARAIKPFLERFVWPQKESRAFFIRYDDEHGPHVRLRLRGESDTLRPAVAEWFGGRGEIREAEYKGEPERFGGAEGLVLAEGHFHASTRLVLDRLCRVPYVYGDAMFDAMRSTVIMAYCAGFSRDRAAWYFKQLCDQWLLLFFQQGGEGEPTPEKILEEFEDLFLPQQEYLRISVDELWRALKKGKFDQNQPEWQRWLTTNKLILESLGDNLELALPSLIHLNFNRMGINNQDEVYLNYLLSRSV